MPELAWSTDRLNRLTADLVAFIEDPERFSAREDDWLEGKQRAIFEAAMIISQGSDSLDRMAIAIEKRHEEEALTTEKRCMTPEDFRTAMAKAVGGDIDAVILVRDMCKLRLFKDADGTYGRVLRDHPSLSREQWDALLAKAEAHEDARECLDW